MGQNNAIRIQFQPRETILNPQNNDRQDLAFTGYLKVGDTVDIIDVDSLGNIISVLADNLTVLNIIPNQAVVLSAAVDTTSATDTPQIRVQPIDDVQEAIDRLYRRKLSGPIAFERVEPVLDQRLDTPVNGQAKYLVADVSHIRAGDKIDIIADEGTAIDQATVLAVDPNADDSNNKASITLDTSVDVTGAFTNPLVVVTNITTQSAIERVQERVDQIDKPVENEDLNTLNGPGDGSFTCYEMVNLFLEKSSKLLLDGSRMKLGTAGDRGELSHGATNALLEFTSMIMGLDGNKTNMVITSGAGVAVAVSGNFNSGYTVTVSNNAGAATAKDIADAINAHVEARRIVQAIYGGDGLGLPATLITTPLAGGLENGVGDYAELEQVFENLNTATGFKFISFHIRPNEQNRMNKPPKDDEEMVADYREAHVNADR